MVSITPSRPGTAATAFFWIALALPAWPMLADFWNKDRYYPELMHDSGVLSAQLLVATLLVSPLVAVLKNTGISVEVVRWITRCRRHLGVAGFAYAAIHLAFYLRETASLSLIVLEAVDLEMLVGWFSFCLLCLLAVTSNNWSVRRLLTRWKALHLWTYPAVLLAFLHWYLFDSFINEVLTWFAILLIARFVKLMLSRTQRPA
ncbi:MAG: ferric reductase-like transmembrane domain-containing protein [Pseudomonadota bacterium]